MSDDTLKTSSTLARPGSSGSSMSSAYDLRFESDLQPIISW